MQNDFISRIFPFICIRVAGLSLQRPVQRTSLCVPKPAAGSCCPQCCGIFWLQSSGRRHTQPVFCTAQALAAPLFLISQEKRKPNINITRLYTALISIFVIFKIVGKSCISIQVGPIPLFACLGLIILDEICW